MHGETANGPQPDVLDEPVARYVPQPLAEHHRRRVVMFAGCNWSFLVAPPYGPMLFPQHTTYRPASSEGVSYSARSGQLPLVAPAISHWHQSGNLWSTLPRGITLTIAWTDCPPAGPDKQRGMCSGIYLGDRFAPKLTLARGDIGGNHVFYVLIADAQ